MNLNNIEILQKKGVNIPNPSTVLIGDDVDLERISPDGVTLFSGTKLTGAQTLIMPGTVLGYETPVTVENCLMGPGTKLHGGYFQDTVFMGDNVFGSGGHVRKGCILEEQANAAHTVGIKQTILFPFVTLGSLINFCDCLMAGGTSRKDHSEVGSSFIHFNYTPNQDKATASMMGNVHQGVMLDRPPIFMGGQGGLVGPSRIGFGCITAAGSIIRKSEERPGRLIMGGGLKNGSMPWQTGVYTQPEKILEQNLTYIGQLFALMGWYRNVRPLFASDFFSEQLITGLQENLKLCIRERIKRLTAFGLKLSESRTILVNRKKGEGSAAIKAHDRVLATLENAEKIFDQTGINFVPDENGEQFIEAVDKEISRQGKAYIPVIQGIAPETAAKGSLWLKGIQENLISRFEK